MNAAMQAEESVHPSPSSENGVQLPSNQEILTQPQSPAELVRQLLPENLFHHRARQTEADNHHHGGTPKCSSDYNVDVTKAIRNRDLSQLRVMLLQGYSFDCCNRNGEYLIHLACRRADVATVEFLLSQARVNPNVRDLQGRSILHDAFWRPRADPELVAYLLEWVDPRHLLAKDDRGFVPLDYVRGDDWRLWKIFYHVKLNSILKRLE